MASQNSLSTAPADPNWQALQCAMQIIVNITVAQLRSRTHPDLELASAFLIWRRGSRC